MRDKVEQTLVYIVDDNESVRESLGALLTAHGYRTRSCASGEEFMSDLDAANALCAFVDLRMPGLGGIDVQNQVTAKGLTVPIVILTAHGDVPLAVQAMKAGALDFIEKPASESQLLGALEAAGHRLANRVQPSIPSSVVSERIARLTSREKEVLDHLILGMTNKHIADELGISQRTVEIHRARIREKMEARGLADLIRMVR